MADRCGALVTVENQGAVAMKSRRGSGRMHTTTRAVCVPGSPRRSGRRSSLEIRSPSRVDGWMGPLSATTLQKRRRGNRASQAVQCRGRSTSIILLFCVVVAGRSRCDFSPREAGEEGNGNMSANSPADPSFRSWHWQVGRPGCSHMQRLVQRSLYRQNPN
jgi:hypothetical protein